MNHGLKLTEAISLGLHIMTLLASWPKGERASVKELVECLPVSEAHSAKVLQRLAKAGLVESVRGPGGGFVLAHPAEQIVLMEIYEAIEGPMHLVSPCLLGHSACGRRNCVFGPLVSETHEKFEEYFRNTRLSQLVENGE